MQVICLAVINKKISKGKYQCILKLHLSENFFTSSWVHSMSFELDKILHPPITIKFLTSTVVPVHYLLASHILNLLFMYGIGWHIVTQYIIHETWHTYYLKPHFLSPTPGRTCLQERYFILCNSLILTRKRTKYSALLCQVTAEAISITSRLIFVGPITQHLGALKHHPDSLMIWLL